MRALTTVASASLGVTQTKTRARVSHSTSKFAIDEPGGATCLSFQLWFYLLQQVWHSY